MISVEEHLATILAAVRPTEPVRLPLSDCLGLVLCQEIRSLVDLPGFDNSAMDGYAVRSADVEGADAAVPGTAVTLPVVGEVATGGVATVPVRPGEAVRIMTGAMMPAGADAVIRVEDTDGGTETVEIRQGAAVGASVRPAGEDVRAGTVVLEAGSVIDARRVALLAATGHGEVLVRPRPRVAVVSTGAELVLPGEPLAPGQIHDSNSHMLEAALAESGAVTTHRLTIGDESSEVIRVVEDLAEQVDAIITSGGVSMGAYDVVKEALRDTGTMEFVQVRMQPGKPQGFGTVGKREVPLFALPGNPVSSYVSFEVFVRPALRTMMGLVPAGRPALTARLMHALGSPAGRTQIARAVAVRDGSGWLADPVWGQASHFVADLSRANALLLVPAEVTQLAAGDEVEMWLLDGAESPASRGAEDRASVGEPEDEVRRHHSERSTPREGVDTTATSLTHVRADGSARMVDVSAKEITSRSASAAGRVLLSAEAIAALRAGRVPKGDALAVARIAGIQAVKRTPDLIPLAHPIAVHGVEIDVDVMEDAVEIRATVRTADRTGIEMEALTAVSVAALALIDMVKAVDRHARLTDVRVVLKSGGRSGDWSES
jgi:molybdenum cofactor biosynthesis protein MoaC